MRFISRFYNSRVQAVSGKNEQTAQTAWRGAPISAGPMQLHRPKAGPANRCNIF